MRISILVLFLTIIATSLAKAKEVPIVFDCELERRCVITPNQWAKENECKNIESYYNHQLIFIEKDGFWFDERRYEFDYNILDRHNFFRFTGISSPIVKRLGEMSNYGDYEYKISLFKYQNDVMISEVSNQQIITSHYVCKQ